MEKNTIALFGEILGYKIYRDGSILNKKGLNIKFSKDKDGYNLVGLRNNGKRNSFRVHRLVANVFLGLDINDIKTFVCHKDDNPSNNNVDNLFLGSCKDNVDDMIYKGKAHFQNNKNNMKGKLGELHHNSKKIIQYDLFGNVLKIWGSMADISRELKISQSRISLVCNGLAKSTKGYKFTFN